MHEQIVPNYLLNIIRSDEAIDFGRIEAGQFIPALEHYVDFVRNINETAKVEAGVLGFNDIFLQFEWLENDVTTMASLFHTMLSCGVMVELRDVAGKFFAGLSDLYNDLLLNPDVFRHVQHLHDELEAEGEMDVPVDVRLVRHWFRRFQRDGAALDDEQKGRLREIDARLSELWPQFQQNVQDAMDACFMDIHDEKLLLDLPENTVKAARAAAQEAGMEEGWRFPLSVSSFVPFMKFVPDAALRQQFSMEWDNLCSTGDERDNRALIREIIELRHERAQLLGFETHAHYELTERMLNTPEKVAGFLEPMLQRLKPAGRKLHDMLAEFAPEYLEDGRLNNWDRALLLERYRRATMQFNEDDLQPYFELDATVEAMFNLARDLFGLNFAPADLPGMHETVRAFSVSEDDGQFTGYLYLDLYRRRGKQEGAWCNSFRLQHRLNGLERRPHVMFICNFQQPGPDNPTLLSFKEARTLLHEFGHALHSLCSECTFPSLSGTSVALDFVELPSQLMENFMLHHESLARIGRHYQTGAPIPRELIDKINVNRTINSGHAVLYDALAAWLDQRWHSRDGLNAEDPIAFEQSIFGEYLYWRQNPGSNLSCSFSHIFASGYAAGYYSYLWSKILDADAFEEFLRDGILNQKTARRYRREVLARGSEAEPLELFHNFCGRDPDITPFLRREGLL